MKESQNHIAKPVDLERVLTDLDSRRMLAAELEGDGAVFDVWLDATYYSKERGTYIMRFRPGNGNYRIVARHWNDETAQYQDAPVH